MTTTPTSTFAPPPLRGTLRDLKPLLQRNDSNGLSHAEKVRDEIYVFFQGAAASKQVEVLILQSDPFTSPPWVQVQCWIRHAVDPNLTLRSSALLTVRPREFHRFPVEIDLVTSNDKQQRTVRSIINFQAEDAATVLDYLLFERRSHKFGLSKCRAFPFQLWLPKNKPARLGNDPMAIAVQVLFVLGFITLGFGIGVLFLLIAGLLAYSNGKRRRHVLSAGKPAQEPRRLIRLDSWQKLINGLGPARASIRQAFREELAQGMEDEFSIADEKIWHFGVDGKEEREQLVVRFRRGLAFVHIYQYGNDLFFGWVAHVNCGNWVERLAGAGFDKTTHELCAVHSIAAGWHIPNEYDITDTNCLLERVHAAATKILKRSIVEHNIDQEIDFTILREARQNISGRQDGAVGTIESGVRGIVSKFRRVG